MQATDKADFTALIAKTWRFYGKQPTGEDVADWFELLAEFPLGIVATAFRRHLTDPQQGQYLPKPADVIRHLPLPRPEDDGRPSADEAWGILLRLVRDEAETGVLSDEIREGWQACGPILDAGDEVGARRCFIDAYSRRVQRARERHEPVRWTVTLGTDRQLRQERVSEAIRLGRISTDHAQALLPGPSNASISQVAGLLEGPDATPQEAAIAARLRGLVAIINAGSQAAEDRRKATQAQQRALESAERERIETALQQRGISLDDTEQAA
ncbi:MAG: hypothetical protein ABTR07_02305 [Candidatus Competibacter denitrificans]